jgi:flagellar hook assembly protein FlgD
MQASDRFRTLKLAAIVTVAGLALFNTAGHAQQRPPTMPDPITTAVTAPVLFTTTAGPTTIHLSWSAVAGATSYEIFRRSGGPPFAAFPHYTLSAPVTSFTDVVPQNQSYYYYVRARNGTELSAGSNVDLGTTVSFTNDPIVAQRDEVHDFHVTELRTAINYARVSAGLSLATWSHPDLTDQRIFVEDVQELRDTLNAARTAAQMPVWNFTDPTLERTRSVIKKVYFKELRQAVKGVQPGGVLTVANPSVSEPFFSPNGDVSKDTTTVLATISSADSDWTVRVKSLSGTTLRTASGFGKDVSYVWDGRDGAGNVQPDGSYTFLIDAVDGIYTATGATSAVLDRTVPDASINSPAAGTTLSNVRQNGDTTVTATGTATDTHLLDWAVSYGLTSGSQTTTFGTGASAVSNAPLGTWNSGASANGAYTIKLVARDKAGNSGTAIVDVTVGHFYASQNAYSLNAATGEAVTYTSVIPFPLTETLTIRNNANVIVRTLFNGARAAGTYNDLWDGKNDAGNLLSDGPYSHMITITEGASSLTWDLSNQMRSGSATQYPYPSCSARTMPLGPCDGNAAATRRWDPFTNDPLKIRYSVAEASVVTVLSTTLAETTSSCGDPNNTCIVNGEFRAPGDHVETWAGVLSTGAAVAPKPYLTVIRRTDTFPRNVVVLHGHVPPVRVSNLTLTPSAYGPERGTMAITFDLTTFSSIPANVTLAMIRQPTPDANMSALRTVSLTAQNPGPVTYTWDGKADNGLWVAPGEYTLLVTATADGRSSTATSRFIVLY